MNKGVSDLKLKTAAGGWLAAAWLLLVAQLSVAGTLAGSKHDFSAAAWDGGQICVACHTPHNANSTAAPLWNHAVSTASYTLYTSTMLHATILQPMMTDKLCLSCHDGTVALDSFGNKTGTAFVSGANLIGTDLTVHHPSSIVFDAALAGQKRLLLNNPDSMVVTIGAGTLAKQGTITAVMLNSNHQLQCSGCHDVHNTYNATTDKLLKISNAGNSICFACHRM